MRFSCLVTTKIVISKWELYILYCNSYGDLGVESGGCGGPGAHLLAILVGNICWCTRTLTGTLSKLTNAQVLGLSYKLVWVDQQPDYNDLFYITI